MKARTQAFQIFSSILSSPINLRQEEGKRKKEKWLREAFGEGKS
jgi:hypothetical protein